VSVLKVELELDWFDGENGTVSDDLKNQVIRGLQDRLINKVEQGIKETIELKINEAAEKVTSDLLINIFNERLQNTKIPYKTSSWDSQPKELTLSEFVGMKYDDFLKRKVLDERGEYSQYKRDAKFTIWEYFAKGMLGKELEKKVSNLISEARQKAEDTVLKTLEQNLREQLSADIINRLNIPAMLKSLQEKAAEIEMTGQDK
jgi:hypothetical protein